MSNYYYYKDDLGDHYLPADLNASFTNCIVYGSLDNELDRDARNESTFDYVFDHCVMKLADTVNIDNSHFINVLKNEDPRFVDYSYEIDNYHLDSGSPCIDAGIFTDVLLDLDGKSRSGSPDIGCYEYVQ
jgi:hypothetical protein